jgi:hypothetical protein
MAQRDDDRRQWCTNRVWLGLIRALVDAEQQLVARDPSLRRSCVQAHLHVEISVDGCAHARTHARTHTHTFLVHWLLAQFTVMVLSRRGDGTKPFA